MTGDDPSVTPLRLVKPRERVLPHNVEAEHRLLGAILADNAVLPRVAFLKVEHFYWQVHGMIFKVASSLISYGSVANYITLKDFFNYDPELFQHIGGAEYLKRLEESGVTSSLTSGSAFLRDAEDYAKRIVDLANRRALISGFEEAIDDAHAIDVDRSLDEIIEFQRNRLDEIRRTALPAVYVYDAGDLVISAIPPRGWLLGVTFCRKFISGLIADGGAGKTAIRYVQLLAAASGKNLTGEHVHHRSRVLIVCLEDDLSEVQRRIGAAMLRHGIAPKEVKGWLFYCTPKGLKLLQTDPRGARTIGALYRELRAIIKEHNIDIVAIDPFVKAHGVEENDNNAIDQVCEMLAQIADEFDCAVDLTSHARKGPAEPGDSDRDRGASAKKDAGRLMYTVTPMSAAEATLYEVDERDRRALVRVDDAKRNLVPNLPDTKWFRLVGKDLGNRNELYPSGDNVQTVERWSPPDAFAVLDRNMIEQILDKITEGPYEGGRYSPSPRAEARAAWPMVQKACPALNEKQAKNVIATWLKSEVLIKRDHKDPKDRKIHPGLFVGKRPGDTWRSNEPR